MHSVFHNFLFIFSVFLQGNSCIEDSNETNLNLMKFSENFCGKTISDSQFLLESQNYPKNYSSNSNCEIILKSDKIEKSDCPVYYKFRFLDFNIEYSAGCVKDRFEIGLDDAICGFKNGTKTYFAKNGTLNIKFISDNENSGKGYKILVTKIEECKSKKETNFLTKSIPKLYPNLPKCCIGNGGNSKHFFLKSPEFPFSMSSKNECVFQIIKSSPDICRIRMKFHFFWFGNSLDCREGFLEIDGKVVCGCKNELNLLTTFSNNVKILRFKSEGLVRDSYSGFVTEIFQDECPKKVQNRTKRFLENRFYNNNIDTSYDVYVFTYPNFENRRKEREETNFVEIESMDNFKGNSVDKYQECLKWNQLQFDTIFTDNQIQLEKCEKNEISNEKQCLEFYDKNGFFFSPGYPFFYSGNMNFCYRFLRLRGSCALRIHFLDFRIGFSEVCSDDRIELGNEGVYCGTSLFNRIVTLNFDQMEFIDVNLVSTISRCFQGFKAVFEQIPCQEIITEQPPPLPFTKIVPLDPTSTFAPPTFQCNRLIRKKIFTIFKEDSPECTYIIEKYSENVCRLLLDFEQFSLDCTRGNLEVNGENYCGNQLGRKMNIEFRNGPIKIHYKLFDSYTPQIFFKINGIQDSINCDEPEVPAQINK